VRRRDRAACALAAPKRRRSGRSRGRGSRQFRRPWSDGPLIGRASAKTRMAVTRSRLTRRRRAGSESRVVNVPAKCGRARASRRRVRRPILKIVPDGDRSRRPRRSAAPPTTPRPSSATRRPSWPSRNTPGSTSRAAVWVRVPRAGDRPSPVRRQERERRISSFVGRERSVRTSM